MKVGDLVVDMNDHMSGIEEPETGLVIAIVSNVEIPPLIEVLWSEGIISRTYTDDLKILCKSQDRMVK